MASSYFFCEADYGLLLRVTSSRLLCERCVAAELRMVPLPFLSVGRRDYNRIMSTILRRRKWNSSQTIKCQRLLQFLHEVVIAVSLPNRTTHAAHDGNSHNFYHVKSKMSTYAESVTFKQLLTKRWQNLKCRTMGDRKYRRLSTEAVGAYFYRWVIAGVASWMAIKWSSRHLMFSLSSCCYHSLVDGDEMERWQLVES